MPGPRRSTRQAAQLSSSPQTTPNNKVGTKRKAEDASSPAQSGSKKRGRSSKKQQKTLEETMPDLEESKEQKDEEMQDVEPKANGEGKEAEYERPAGCWFWLDNATYPGPDANGHGKPQSNGDEASTKPGEAFEGENKEGESKSDPEKALKDSRGGPGANALDQVKADEGDAGKTNKKDRKEEEPADDTTADNESAIEQDKQREKAEPDNLLEKGIIYFFTRGRVGVDDPNSVSEIQRSYFVLRPLPPGGKITDGAIQDVGNNRLIALPKKVWPKSGRDRFLAFVEKASVSMDTLREEFFQGSEYSTKTTGTRHTPAVTPLGEGVYAMAVTGGGRGITHLAYMLTIPQELGEVQRDFGLAEKGSFVLSTKNPESSSPANASLPQGPDYPKQILDEFSGRGWLPSKPEHLNYANAQFLLIGESGGVDAIKEDQKNGEETAAEELEKLEHEDDLRVEHLNGDDTVFVDLGISSKEYPEDERVAAFEVHWSKMSGGSESRKERASTRLRLANEHRSVGAQIRLQ